MTKACARETATVGVAEHGNSAVLVTLAPDRTLIDRRRVDLTHGLPTHPYHHEGSWSIGRYVGSAWARRIAPAEAVALIERVHAAAARGASGCLEALAAAVPLPIACITLRECLVLPATIEQRIADTRAANVADSVMYREALAGAARERGWAVHWYDRARVSDAAALVLGGCPLGDFLRDMGRAVGAPWQAGHKLAATAAIAAMAHHTSPARRARVAAS